MSNLYECMVDKNISFIKKTGAYTILGHISRIGYKDFTVDLRGCDITTIPGMLIIYGSLQLQGCNISELPHELMIYDSLDLRDTSLKNLPEDLEVGGSLLLGNSGLTELPAAFYVGNDLDLQNTPIRQLPERLYVGGDLNIKGTSVTALPDDLFVGSQLLLDAANITHNLAYRQVDLSAIADEMKSKSSLPFNLADFINCDPNGDEPLSHLTVFAVRLQDEIKISAGCFYGTVNEFSGITVINSIKSKVQECIDELNAAA